MTDLPDNGLSCECPANPQTKRKTNVQTYLDALRTVLAEGQSSTDRTGTGTISHFGMQSRYDLQGFSVGHHQETASEIHHP